MEFGILEPFLRCIFSTGTGNVPNEKEGIMSRSQQMGYLKRLSSGTPRNSIAVKTSHSSHAQTVHLIISEEAYSKCSFQKRFCYREGYKYARK